MLNLIVAKNITKLKHRFPLRQIRKIPLLFRVYWPVLSLLLITSLLAFLNYEPGTFLIGWDNLNPEFDTWMNLKRSLFSVWQEHRSLGLLAGQAHSADLPRILIIFLLEFFKTPLSIIRYLTTFAPLIAGPIGVYFLFNHHLFREKLDGKTTQFASFLGALFYLLNLNTLQTFFIPFETFTWFYGALPWLLFFTISYLSHPSPLKLFALFATSFISAPAFYVETIYLVFFVSAFPFFVEFFSQKRALRKSIKTFFLGLSSLVVPHLFWLLPVAFFVFTGAHVAENAHINIISSPETYYRNLEFANLKDLALIKGYLFNYLDMGANYKYDYLLSVWRSHLNTPIISILGYLIFTTVLVGLYYSLKKKFTWTASFISTLCISLYFLLGGGLLINQAIPLIGELFRSPFTKFSIPLSLSFAFFFSIGTVFILDLFTFLHSRLTYAITLFTVTVLLLIYMSPAFSNNLISSNMRLAIPNEYFELFSFFKTQDQATRIANFPQYTFWGWNYYDWGYRGSGFLWHGIQQPLLDRAFDVWDQSSEHYYEEISTAIYSGDSSEFEHLVDKYAITWIMIDKHVISPDGKTDLGLQTLEKFMDSTKFTLEKNFNDSIFVYKNNLENINRFVSTSATTSDKPFNNLSLRPTSDWTEKAGFLSISKDLATPSSVINIPSLTDSENLIPVNIEYQKQNGFVNLRLTPITPVVFAGDKQVDLSSDPVEISIPIPAEDSFVLQVDDHYFLLQLPAEVTSTSNYSPLAPTYVPTKTSFDISIYSVSQANFRSLSNELSLANPTQCYVEKPNRTIEKIISPDGISLLGTDVNGCLSVPIPVTPQDTLISYSFVYSSPSLTTGNVNITGDDFITTDVALPLEPSSTPKKTTLFTHSTGKDQQLNLVLEAEGTKSVQEIAYRDITLSSHPLLFQTFVTLDEIPTQTISLDESVDRLQVSLPLTATEYDILQTPQANSLFPENRNCDQFSQGKTVKIVREDGFVYQSQNAIQCDFLNLRHLPHTLNYLLSFTTRYEKGLSLTTCLENYSTRRCDVFERLSDTESIQSVVNPISNHEEAPGYTLHFFNQSIGNRISSNILRSISIRPVPLRFIKNISTSDIEADTSISQPEVTRHAEFLYTVSANSTDTLNFYQTKSPYWVALKQSQTDSSWSLATRIITNYPNLSKLTKTNTNNWYNSWNISSNDETITLVYLPQYLEFIGLALIPLSFLLLVLFRKRLT